MRIRTNCVEEFVKQDVIGQEKTVGYNHCSNSSIGLLSIGIHLAFWVIMPQGDDKTKRKMIMASRQGLYKMGLTEGQ